LWFVCAVRMWCVTVGLKELTSYKWTVIGSGQIRN
jgi:hypothetical protein